MADGLMDGDIRLYANCHVVGWDASAGELEQIRRFLDAQWGAEWQEACEDFSLDDLSGSEVGPGMAFPMPMEEGDHAVIYPR